MSRFSLLSLACLATDVAFLVICLFHLPYLSDRATVPFDAEQRGDALVIAAASGDHEVGLINEGDTIATWNGTSLHSVYQLEFLTDPRRIGDRVSLTVKRSGVERTATVELIPFYTTGSIALITFIGVVSWSVGVFLLVMRPRDGTALLLHWALVNLGVVHIMTWGMLPSGDMFALSGRVLFLFAYMNVVASFLFFTTLFPRRKSGIISRNRFLIIIPAVVLFAIASLYQTRTVLTRTMDDLELFRVWFSVLQSGAIAYIIAGTFNFVHSYRATIAGEERRKLQWLLWSLSIGPAPFVLLTLLPQIFIGRVVVSEEYTLVSFILIPLAFAISFLRYHILDVEVIINRTTVYAVVIAVLLTFYLGCVGLIAFIVGSYTPATYTVLAVLTAVLFEPARKLVQRFVDRRFFRVRYDFREAERQFLDRIQYAPGAGEVGTILIRETQALIPVERIGLFLLNEESSRLRCVAHENMEAVERHGLTFEREHLKTTLQQPVALDGVVEQAVPYEPADAQMFNRWGLAMVFPMLTEAHRFVGFLVLGRKKSGGRFTLEDVDLLRNVVSRAALTIERIQMQKNLARKEAETRHLQELNEMKSTFVEYVSHELKTPLGGIKIHAELLQRKKVDAKARKHLAVIDGEVERLNRMVTNILDAAQIENGGQVYHFRETDLKEIAGRAVKSMEYLLKANRFRLVFRPGRNALPVLADPDALHLALTNLIGNAIKYHSRKRCIRIALKSIGTRAECSVQDHGRGISREALPHLFERYYRGPDAKEKIQGVGLGLSVVKHIMEAHNGAVNVTSRPGKGSTFTLIVPLLKGRR